MSNEILTGTAARRIRSRHSNKGAETELRICADLISRGWEIFRAVSPATSCDLVGRTPRGQLVRIECTSVDRPAPTRCPHFHAHNAANYDLICGAERNTGELFYKIDPDTL